VPQKLTTGKPSASAAVAYSSPANGRAKPSHNAAPTEPPSSVKPCLRREFSAPEIKRLASNVLAGDGKPRFVWTDTKPDPQLYARIILHLIAERHGWKAQYEAAKAARLPLDSLSATAEPAP
jgi:hypothetical protein